MGQAWSVILFLLGAFCFCAELGASILTSFISYIYCSDAPSPTISACPHGAIVPDLKALEQNVSDGAVCANLTGLQQMINVEEPRYVFISGAAYSGTTSLYSLVSTSPEASNLCNARQPCCEGGPILVNRGLVPLANAQNMKYDKYYPVDWNEAITVFRKYWNTSKSILVEKSAGNMEKLIRLWDALKQEKKRAYFIFVVRSKCYHTDLKQWQATTEIIISVVRQLRSQGAHVHIVRYEEMLGDPYGVSRDLLKFLPDLQCLDPAKPGLHDAAFVTGTDTRALSLVDFVRTGRPPFSGPAKFPFSAAGDLISVEEGAWMMELGYTTQWFQNSKFINTLDEL